jgi:hypothetical protein
LIARRTMPRRDRLLVTAVAPGSEFLGDLHA